MKKMKSENKGKNKIPCLQQRNDKTLLNIHSPPPPMLQKILQNIKFSSSSFFSNSSCRRRREIMTESEQ
jgi:hypothetical protein